MIDKGTEDFIDQNLESLDELSLAYAEYRQQLSEDYWQHLCGVVGPRTPSGYKFHADAPFFKPGSERFVGWYCMIGGQEISIGFGVHLDVERLVRGQWPYSGLSHSWTGIKIQNLETKLLAELSHAAKEYGLDSNPAEDGWQLWQEWTELTTASPRQIHQSLRKNTRNEGHQKIVDELLRWTKVADKVL